MELGIATLLCGLIKLINNSFGLVCFNEYIGNSTSPSTIPISFVLFLISLISSIIFSVELKSENNGFSVKIALL